MNEIARGGNGVVYEVEDTELKRRIAIKVLFRNCRTLSNEAKIMSQLDHPNICSIYDAGEFHHRTFVAMQLIQGPSLTEFCRTPAVLSCQQVVEVMVKALDVVGKCHSMGIVHLDLKPANILMSGQEPVIIDFGLARTSGIAQNVMQALGSPSYMAPELFANELYTPATMCDLFSMGVIFYELLTGKRPFTGLGEGQNHVFPPRRPRDHRNEIPEELERICLRAISESPSQRYQSAQDFQSELLYWLQSSGGHSSVRTSLAISVDPPSRVIEKKSQLKYWVITWFLLLLVLIVNLIGLVF
ncbi:MAG: serine/threonine-protein kinase [Planctomycetota bacterium]